MSITNRVLLLAVFVATACSKEQNPEDKAEESRQGAAPAQPEEPHAPTQLELLMAKTSLADAIDFLKPQMGDAVNDINGGAVMLAVWGAKKMRLADVAVAKNETSAALVHKDSDAARGKRMCVRGEIVEIAKDGSLPDAVLFRGLLLTGYSNITSFVAVGSTGELVARSRARFCGVVIGRFDYANSGGGTSHAISLVGMFDLPENR